MLQVRSRRRESWPGWVQGERGFRRRGSESRQGCGGAWLPRSGELGDTLGQEEGVFLRLVMAPCLCAAEDGGREETVVMRPERVPGWSLLEGPRAEMHTEADVASRSHRDSTPLLTEGCRTWGCSAGWRHPFSSFLFPLLPPPLPPPLISLPPPPSPSTL